MWITLHKLTILLRSSDGRIRRLWQRLFQGWVHSDGPRTGEPHICLELERVSALPSLPDAPPFFTDEHTQPEGAGVLSVYQDADDFVTLAFQQGAAVSVSLYSGTQDHAPVASGLITDAALEHGCLEDITFTSLAPLLRRRNYYLVHAFAASKDGRALLIVGPSGSGKTTTGLSLLLHGWKLLANDVLLLEERPDGVYALPTPGEIGIRPGTLELLPPLRSWLGRRQPIDGAYTLSGAEAVRGKWSEAVPIAAVCFPEIEKREVSVAHPEKAAVVLARLMEESVDRWDRAMLSRHMSLLQTVSQQAQAYTLRLGADVIELPQLLACLI